MDERFPIPLSALQHWRFCPRQCVLIHREGVWKDNRFTAEGETFHEHVHERGEEIRGGVRTVRGLTLCSQRLGLIGKADAVEFRKGQPPFPVEYKRGRPKHDGSDALQLCAQALCLEEMLDVTIPQGALFYGASRRRQEVAFSDPLRNGVIGAAKAIRLALSEGPLPPLAEDQRCKNCSLQSWCEPLGSVSDYLREALNEC